MKQAGCNNRILLDSDRKCMASHKQRMIYVRYLVGALSELPLVAFLHERKSILGLYKVQLPAFPFNEPVHVIFRKHPVIQLPPVMNRVVFLEKIFHTGVKCMCDSREAERFRDHTSGFPGFNYLNSYIRTLCKCLLTHLDLRSAFQYSLTYVHFSPPASL